MRHRALFTYRCSKVVAKLDYYSWWWSLWFWLWEVDLNTNSSLQLCNLSIYLLILLFGAFVFPVSGLKPYCSPAKERSPAAHHELQKGPLPPTAHLHFTRGAAHWANIRRPRDTCLQTAEKGVEEKAKKEKDNCPADTDHSEKEQWQKRVSNFKQMSNNNSPKNQRASVIITGNKKP